MSKPKLSPPDNVKEMHFYKDGLNFPIVIFVCNDWEKTQLSYLDTKKHSSESLIKWCINHNISYQVIYSLNRKSIIKNPHKALAYVKMKVNIKQYSAITKN